MDIKLLNDGSMSWLPEIQDHDIIFVTLPNLPEEKNIVKASQFQQSELSRICSVVRLIATELKAGGKLLVLGQPQVLPYIHIFLPGFLKFHDWIAIRQKIAGGHVINQEHSGLTIYSKEVSVLDHSKVRIAYEYCSHCSRTRKDYGGKKHLYDAYGTLMSDVWKDIEIESNSSPPQAVLNRIRDMFSVSENRKMLTLVITNVNRLGTAHFSPSDTEQAFPPIKNAGTPHDNTWIQSNLNSLILGDAVQKLSLIPDNTIDFAFADPPYNLSKKYNSYSDNVEVVSYFKWCDLWMEHLYRVLKPGGVLSIINIPISTMRHFLYLQRRLTFQNWIVWESLSLPLRLIMPSHYPILLFSKGDRPRVFNYDRSLTRSPSDQYSPDNFVLPFADEYCIRISCLLDRKKRMVNSTKELTDLWTDIHRVKHNSRRVNHPCQLPPKLMKRLISLLTNPGDIVLDCFNGVGTTTLSAHQLGRNYIGIEIDELYHRIASERHQIIRDSGDPFRKSARIPISKNNSVPRVRPMKYEVPKRTLQLAIKELARNMGRIPSRDDVVSHGRYPIGYYDKYFRNWSEVTAAARTSGMRERKDGKVSEHTILDFVG